MPVSPSSPGGPTTASSATARSRRVSGPPSYPGKDVGTSLLTGATEERFEILKWFYIEADDDTGYDAAAEVIERSMTYLDPDTVRMEPDADVEETRDLLADVADVLGSQKVPAADVPSRLRKLAPGYPLYRPMSGIRLRELLAEHGIKVPSTGRRYPVDPAAIRARIAERAHERGGEGTPWCACGAPAAGG